MKHLLTSILSLAVVVTAIGAEFKIDADYPGGNIVVSGIDGDTVRLAPPDFYWSFRVRGAEGRTLNFEIANASKVWSGAIGTRGPAVSSNNGVTWRWLGDKTGFSTSQFQYVFGPDEKEVLVSSMMNYTERDLNRFLEKYQGNTNLKIETLCRSPQGRSVELLRIPCKAGTKNDGGADFKVFLSARHHAREAAASYALEGILETVLSDSNDGKWLREHCDFFIVPFVDKDNVETGGQGVDRKPHNHNRDYIARVHPEIRAITEQVPPWQNGKPITWFDMHGPGLRAEPKGDRPENNVRESVYLTGSRSEEFWKKQQRFGRILETEKKGPIPYKETFNVPFGENWNTTAHYGNDGLLSSSRWASSMLSNVVFASGIEIPYANASGVCVDVDSLRLLGRDLARTFRVYLETLEK